MKRKTLLITLLVLSLILLGELVFVGYMMHRESSQDIPETTIPTTSEIATEAPTEAPVETTAAPETTVPPTETEPATEAPTESVPTEIRYTLTFAGDCTLATDSSSYTSPHGFIQTIGTDYEYPFRNVADIFAADDFTIINLESVLADQGRSSGKLFTFRGPTAYTQIMTSSSVEAVTLANNHTEDFGKDGYKSTVDALTAAGVWYVEENKTTLVTTESGLVIGLYADSFDFTVSDIQKNVKKLRDQGAEIVICAFHWGTEGSYRPTDAQKRFGRAAIDAGADIVYGHHPHVLQPIEEYKDGYIFYSLGNFSFGGNHFPRDMDSAILQMEVIRDLEGNVSLGELTIIPVSISSRSGQNNFQPIPYEEGTKEYERTMSKLDGSFTGPDLVVDYSDMRPTEPPTEAPTQPPTEAPDQGGSDATEPGGSGDVTTPPATGGDSGDSGNSGDGGDAGSSGDSGNSGGAGDSGDSGSQTPPPAEGGEG